VTRCYATVSSSSSSGRSRPGCQRRNSKCGRPAPANNITPLLLATRPSRPSKRLGARRTRNEKTADAVAIIPASLSSAAVTNGDLDLLLLPANSVHANLFQAHYFTIYFYLALSLFRKSSIALPDSVDFASSN